MVLPGDSTSVVCKDFHQMILDGHSSHSEMVPQPSLPARYLATYEQKAFRGKPWKSDLKNTTEMYLFQSLHI